MPQHAGLFYAQTSPTPPSESLPLILIHGAGSSHLGWPADLRRLPGRAVLAPDLPGHGRSAGPGHQRIKDYAQALLAWARALGLERALWLGHSMGGAIVQTLALTAPEQVAGLILLGTGAHLPVNPWILEMVQKDFPLLAAKVNAWSWGPGASEEIKTLGLAALLAAPPEVVWGDYQACAAFDLRAQLAAITAPSLVLCGQADKMTPPAESEFLAVQLPQAELRLFAGLGHNAMLEDGPAIAGALQSWLQARGL